MERNIAWNELTYENTLNLVEALLRHADDEFKDEELKTAVYVEWVTENKLRVTGKKVNQTKGKKSQTDNVGTTKKNLLKLQKRTGKSLKLPKLKNEASRKSLENRELDVIQTVLDCLEKLGVRKDYGNPAMNLGYWKFTLTLVHQTKREENLNLVKQKWEKNPKTKPQLPESAQKEPINFPIESSGATSTTLITTPLNLNNWVGREDDINQLQTWLADTEVKTIGIQGFCGVGKSTLGAYLYEKSDEAGFEGRFWANVSNNTNFTVFAEKIITQFGGQVTQRGNITELVNNLLDCLNQRRYLLVVDNLETLLNESRQWHDSGYEQFFESWLKYGRKSTLLLTTQEKPILFQPEPGWYLLEGMNFSDGVKLLRKFQIQGSSPEKEAAELEAFVNSVDGHPLILELVAQYLRAYCDKQLIGVQQLKLQQFQLVDNEQKPNWQSPEKCLSWILEQHFQRLNPNQKGFLFNLSVYRQPFSNEAARCMLTSDEETYNDRELQELLSRSLLLRTEDGKYHFQPFVEQYVHQVIDEQSRDLTAAHWKAYNYYNYYIISHGKELSLEKTIEDVTEYLEAFYHLCQLEEYAEAYRRLEDFAQFLSRWGYYSILVDKYEKLIENRLLVTEQLSQQDLMGLFISLGSLYVYLHNSEQAIKYHEESLSIARELGDRHNEAGSLCNLGHAYKLRGQKQDYEQARICYQQALPILREIGSREFEVNTLGGLGGVYKCLGEYPQAIKYYQQQWDISKEIDYNLGKASAFGGLGSVYQSLKQHQRAILFFELRLKIANSSNNLHLLASALHSLGGAFDSLQDYQEAIEYYQKALPILEKIGDRSGHGGSLCNLGNTYHSLERYQEAIECYQQALPILQQIGHREFEANTLSGLGKTYVSLGQYQEALKYYQQLLVIARKIGDKSKEANAFYALASAYKSLKEWDTAIKYCNSTVNLYHEAGNMSMVGGSLCDLGHAYCSLKRYEEAIESYKKALLILREIGHREFEANTLNGLGGTYVSLGQYQEALECYQQVQGIAKEIDDKSKEARALHALASVYKSLEQWDTAIKYYDLAVILYQEIGDHTMEARALDGLVIAYWYLEQWHQVIKYRKRAEILYYEAGNMSMVGGSLCDLGHAYCSLKRYEEAIESYKKALLILREIGHREFEANTLSGLGGTYVSLGQYQEALECYQQLLDIAQEIGDQSMKADALHAFASAYKSLEQWDTAIKYYDLAVILYQEIGNRTMEGACLCNLGNVYISMSKYRQAVDFCLEALPILQESGHLKFQYDTLCILVDAYKSLEEYDEAIQYEEQKMEIERSLNNRG